MICIRIKLKERFPSLSTIIQRPLFATDTMVLRWRSFNARGLEDNRCIVTLTWNAETINFHFSKKPSTVWYQCPTHHWETMEALYNCYIFDESHHHFISCTNITTKYTIFRNGVAINLRPSTKETYWWWDKIVTPKLKSYDAERSIIAYDHE